MHSATYYATIKQWYFDGEDNDGHQAVDVWEDNDGHQVVDVSLKPWKPQLETDILCHKT